MPCPRHDHDPVGPSIFPLIGINNIRAGRKPRSRGGRPPGPGRAGQPSSGLRLVGRGGPRRHVGMSRSRLALTSTPKQFMEPDSTPNGTGSGTGSERQGARAGTGRGFEPSLARVWQCWTKSRHLPANGIGVIPWTGFTPRLGANGSCKPKPKPKPQPQPRIVLSPATAYGTRTSRRGRVRVALAVNE